MPRKSKREGAAPPRSPATIAPQPGAPPLSGVGRAAAAVGGLALAVYAASAHRFVAGGDSGELTVVAATLGVAHPPGYPLYALLGKAFSLLPLGTIAWRVSLLSAAANAAAAGLLASAVARWSSSLWAGVLAALLFAFSPLVWTYAVTAEVFALNNLFVAGLVFLAVRFAERPDIRTARWAALWIGLGLANHHTFVFYAAPFALWLSWQGRAVLGNPRTLAGLVGLIALGLLPYLYLPLAGVPVPLMGWGDTTTLDGFVRHVSRAEYGTFQLGTDRAVAEGAMARRLLLFVRAIPAELAYVGAPLALVGLVASLRARGRGRLARLGALWLAAFLLYTVSFAALSNLGLDVPLAVTVQSRFWQQSLLLLCVWAGLGFAAAVLRLRAERAAAVLVVVLGVSLLLSRYRAQDRSGNLIFRDYGRALLEPLPPGALLLTQGDHVLGTLRYLQRIDGYRTDVAVLDQSQLGFDWAPRWVAAHFPDVVLPPPGVYSAGGYDMRRFLDANLSRRPIYVAGGVLEWDRSLRPAYTTVPAGLAFKFVRVVDGEPDMTVEELRALNDPVFSTLDPLPFGRYGPPTWEWLVDRNYWRSYEAYAVELLTQAARHPPVDPKAVQAGISALERCVRDSRHAEPSLFKNLGLGYQLLEPQDPAAVDGAIRAWKRYLELIPAAHPDAVRMSEAVRQMERQRR